MHWPLNLPARSDTGSFCSHSFGQSKNRDPSNFKWEGKYNPGILCLEGERARIGADTNSYHRKEPNNNTNINCNSDKPSEGKEEEAIL